MDDRSPKRCTSNRTGQERVVHSQNGGLAGSTVEPENKALALDADWGCWGLGGWAGPSCINAMRVAYAECQFWLCPALPSSAQRSLRAPSHFFFLRCFCFPFSGSRYPCP